MKKLSSQEAQGIFSVNKSQLIINKNDDNCYFVGDRAKNMKDVKIVTTSHWDGCVTDNVAQLSVTDNYQLSGCKNLMVFKLLRNGE